MEPNAGRRKTWVIPSGGTLRLAAPPNDATASEILQIKSAIAQLDTATLEQIHFWDAGARGYRWMQMTEQLAVSEGLPTPLQTRALALVGAAIYDATVAAWDSKYAYSRKHPSEIDPTIQTVVPFTQSPSYPSEHAVTAGAAAAVLTYLFPDQADAINKAAYEAEQSRILAGVAFPSDVAAGIEQGATVGKAFVAYAAADRSNLPFTGSFPPTPGVFSSPNPVTPLAGMWRPWVLTARKSISPHCSARVRFSRSRCAVRAGKEPHKDQHYQPLRVVLAARILPTLAADDVTRDLRKSFGCQRAAGSARLRAGDDCAA